ncbi:MAG: alkaline phosphatase family protein, partial [Thermomicrobiaceae bacterium]|nr:alkaline phosphatase family protein [Thermomicrobiaceae bacterium]
VAGAFALSLASWVLESSALLVVAAAAGVRLDPLVALAATAVTIALQAFQITPGGLGLYEAGMSGALGLAGVPPATALTLATLTHGLKFAYSYAVGIPAAAVEGLDGLGARDLFGLRGTARDVKRASRLEIVAARVWNVFNEGKTFTPIYTLGVVLLLRLPHVLDAAFWARLAGALVVAAPLALVFYRFDFPLRLRWALWALLAVFVGLFRAVDPLAVAVTLGLYLTFTIFLWGTLYYHLRLGAPWTNFTRFWRLALENSDSTSGNFLEQAPKTLILVHLLLFLTAAPLDGGRAALALGYALLAGVVAVLVHQWWFTWPTPLPVHPTRDVNQTGRRIARRVIVIVIDGCRRDVLLRADAPTFQRLRREGTEWTQMATIYPARTVACFSSMLTGAAPKVHGMRSNFVPSLGVKCESLFAQLRSRGMLGRLVGIAHLIDPFGEEDVKTVTSVMDNQEIDLALIETAKRTLVEDDPDLLVVQLLSADQAGHTRGSLSEEYRRQVEITDRLIGDFLDWLGARGYLEGATVVLMADHGQSRGIGGHGHIDVGESPVPFVMWGAGVPAGERVDEPRAVIDLGPTISYFLGLPPTGSATGRTLLTPGQAPSERRDLVAVLIPVHNERGRLAEVIRGVPREALGLTTRVVVVDDGSVDGSAAEARAAGADVVVRHPSNRGLGAALRAGLAQAHALGAEYAVYLDGDGEYDPADLPAVLAPLVAGEADYVIGSRFLGRPEGMRPVRRAGNVAFSLLTSLLAGRWISDGQSGFRGFNRRAIEVAEIIHDYNYAQVLTLDLLKKGMRLVEVPIRYRARRAGRSFVRYHAYALRVLPAMLREVLQP